MSTLTVVRGGIIRPARPLPSKCDEHPEYTAGCRGCRAAGRLRQEARHKAVILGTLQPALVPAIGAARRLQALAVTGYDATHLTPHLNAGKNLIRGWRLHYSPTITRRRQCDIAALTEHLATIPGPSRHARTLAHRKGWMPLAAWDDIDNPDDTPNPGAEHDETVDEVLVRNALAGRRPIGDLNPTEETELYRVWRRQRAARDEHCGYKTFAAQFGIKECQAQQLMRYANQATPKPDTSTAADSRTDERTAA